MTPKDRKIKETKYLRAKYEYYILCEPSMLDSDFDKLEEELRSIGSKVVEIVDFPTIREIKELGLDPAEIVDSQERDETKYAHLTPMLSQEKIQVNDEDNMPLKSVNTFFNRCNSKFVEASSKYDGNGMELIYKDGLLHQGLTRGQDKKYGLDKTNKMKLIVPNEIPFFKDKSVEVRGEVVIDVKLWEKRYSDPDKVDNPRNYVAGVLNRDEYNINTIKDLVFVAYSLVVIDKNGEIEYPLQSMDKLKEMGFNKEYDPFTLIESTNSEGFLEIYNRFKEYREKCPFLLDGIVIKFPEDYRLKLGTNNHHPKWSIAIKFPAKEVSTYIREIDWKLGKDGSLTPLAILEPVELDGTVVTKASLSNIGTIIKKGTFPGAKVSLKKAGEIIPFITGVLKESPNHIQYIQQYEDFMKT